MGDLEDTTLLNILIDYDAYRRTQSLVQVDAPASSPKPPPPNLAPFTVIIDERMKI